MQLKKDLELAIMPVEAVAGKDIFCEVSCELETLFNSVMSTVVDYFEEALTE